MSALEQGAVVRVVARTLSNGAPHPFAGQTGVVLEVHASGPHPLRVRVGGRTVMLAHDELERVVLAVTEPDAAGDGARRTAVPA